MFHYLIKIDWNQAQRESDLLDQLMFAELVAADCSWDCGRIQTAVYSVQNDLAEDFVRVIEASNSISERWKRIASLEWRDEPMDEEWFLTTLDDNAGEVSARPVPLYPDTFDFPVKVIARASGKVAPYSRGEIVGEETAQNIKELKHIVRELSKNEDECYLENQDRICLDMLSDLVVWSPRIPAYS